MNKEKPEKNHPLEPLQEAALMVNKKGHEDTSNLLEAIFQQNEKNNPEPILEATLIQSKKNTKEIVKAVEDLKPVLEKSSDSTKKMVDFLSSMKGEKGDKPSEEELKTIIKPLIPAPIKGDKGDKGDSIKGDKGDDGYTPIKGKDYFDGKDGKTPSEKELKKLINPLIPLPIKGDKGEKGDNGSPDTASEIVIKLESLKGDLRLDASAIKGLEKLIKGKITGNGLGGFYNTGGDGLKFVTTDSTLTGLGTPASPLHAVGGGISLSTNGIPNASQTILNLVQGSNMTINDLGGGIIEFAAVVSPAGTPGNIQYYDSITGLTAGATGSFFDNTTGDYYLPNLAGFMNADITKAVKYDATGLTTVRTHTIPDASGTYVLSVNGTAPDSAGDVTISAGGSAGGSNTQLQYNNAGSFGGITGVTTNGTAMTVTTGNLLVADVKASSSAGVQILSNAGTVTALFGAGGGANSTFYGGTKLDYATASTVPYLDASKNLISSSVTPTELGYLSGVTSAIQTQLNGKLSLSGGTMTGNIAITNLTAGYTTTATAAGTTTLTVNSNYYQFFTGSTTQTVVLPDATTLAVGHRFYIDNNSTGAVTVQTNGGATLAVVAGNTDLFVICTSTATAAGVWDNDYSATRIASGKIFTVNNSITLSGTDSTTITMPTSTSTVLANNLGLSGGTTLVGGTAAGDSITFKATSGTQTGTALVAKWTGGTNGGSDVASVYYLPVSANTYFFQGSNTSTSTNYYLRSTSTASYFNASSDLRLQVGGSDAVVIGSSSISMRKATTMFTGMSFTLAAGTTTVAPLTFQSGTNLTTAVNGVMEYNGTNLFFTRTGATREGVLVGNSGATAPITTATPVFTDYYGGNTKTLGDPVGWFSIVDNGGTVRKVPYY